MSHLSLHHITKAWGDKIALNDITFDAAEGSFVALLGPSGCGKSTLLRTIAGLETADRGEIHFKHLEITHLPPSQRKLSMVFQSYALFPHLNVRENRLDDVSKLMELDKLLDRLPSQLSGGQQQRVALGRAVIANNNLCLMDEPLSNLDAKLRQSMRREIRALQKKLGLTMLYVTHDQTEAMSMADSIILMNDGHIEQQGTPNDLYNNPATFFAAQFIGAPPMNILPLHNKDNCNYLSHLQAPVVEHCDEVALSLGLRAEDIQLISPDHAALKARVISYEYMGADTVLVCQLAGLADAITVKVPGMQHFVEDSQVGLQWSAARQYLFSTTTGKRCVSAEQQMFVSQKKYAV